MNVKKSLSPLTKIFYIYLIVKIISFANCILEIPITTIKVKDSPIAKNITYEEKDNYYNDLNLSIFISEGDGILHSSRLFIATIKIGENKQEFNLILDTGSSITWVADEDSQDQYDINNHFNPSSSKTCSKTEEYFSIKYGTGSCNGYFYKDNCEFIGKKQFKMKFGVARETSLPTLNADGIIGLAHYYSDETRSFIHMLKKGEVTDSLLFSMKFDPDTKDGKMYIGKHKDFSSGKTVTCPLLQYKGEGNTFWGCEFEGFGLKKGSLEVTSSKSFINIVFDTGANHIILPIDYFNDIKDSLSKFDCISNTDSSDLVSIFCSSSTIDDLPMISFKIDGNTLSIPTKYMFYKANPLQYKLRLLFAQKKNVYLIGTPFFLAYHTLFDIEDKKLHFYPPQDDLIKKGTNTVLIVCIVIISIVLVALIVLIVIFYIRRKRAQEMEERIPANNFDLLN